MSGLKDLSNPPRTRVILCLSLLPFIILTQLESSFGEKRWDDDGKKWKDASQTISNNSENNTCSNRNGTSGNNTDGCQLRTKLLLVQVIFRHGDRTPLFSYPKDPHKNASGIPMLKSKRKGLLTKRGNVQAYELGTYIATRYQSFLEGMWLPEDILVQSSMSERSIMTAQTCLSGLFVPYCTDGPQHPEGTGLGCEKRWSREIKWQPIPVYPIPTEMDNKLRFIPERCPAYMEELNRVLGCAPMRKYIAQYESVFTYVKNHTGLDHVDIKNLGQVYDTLFIQDVYKLELPEWTKQVYPEPMKSIEEFGFQILSGTRKLIRLNGGPLVRQVIQNMKQVARELIKNCSPSPKKKGKKNRQKRLYLYAGHDTTVSAFLSALNVFDIHQPPYASAVMIELHQEVDADELENSGKTEQGKGGRKQKEVTMKDMIVKVFYRKSTGEEPREMLFTDCGNPCYLSKFEATLRDIMISDLEWKAECLGLSSSWCSWLLRPLSNLVSWIWGTLKKMWGCGCCDLKPRL